MIKDQKGRIMVYLEVHLSKDCELIPIIDSYSKAEQIGDYLVNEDIIDWYTIHRGLEGFDVKYFLERKWGL